MGGERAACPRPMAGLQHDDPDELPGRRYRPFHCWANSRVIRTYRSPYDSLGSMCVRSHHSFQVVMEIQSGSLSRAASNVER